MNLLTKPHLLLILLGLTALVSFGLGYRQRGLDDAADQVKLLARTSESRRRQDDERALRDAANESAAMALRQKTDERTRRAYQVAPRSPWACA